MASAHGAPCRANTISGNLRGIYPCYMHIVHLALGTDLITSLLMDWTDNQTYCSGPSRDARLAVLWNNYRIWCEDQRIGERAQRRLFTTAALKPAKGAYLEISQKILNATGCRYMLFWVASLAKQFWSRTGSDMDALLALTSVSHNLNPLSSGFPCARGIVQEQHAG